MVVNVTPPNRAAPARAPPRAWSATPPKGCTTARRRSSEHPGGPRIVALLAGIDYLVAATALTHNGRRMRMVGWVTISLSIAIPIVLWVASLGLDELNSARSAWTGLGADFYFLPFIVSIIGLIWMWRSNPRRIVSLAEQVERPSSPWRAH